MPQDDRARTPADIPVSEMERLLSLALATRRQLRRPLLRARATSSLLLEEGIIRTASAGVSCGLGVRVVAGERTGYAYTDDLSWPAMARAAETAAHIASDSRTLPPQPVSPVPVERRYGETSVGVLPLAERIALVERADRAARAYDPRVEKVIASLGEQTRRRAHRQLGGRAGRGRAAAVLDPRQRDREREGRAARGLGRAAAAGSGRSSSRRSRPSTSRARRRARRSRCSAPSRRRPGAMPVVLGPGLARHPPARGDRPRPRGRLQPQGTLGLLRPHRRARGRAGRHGGRRRHDRRPPRQPQRRRRGQPPRPHGADRGRHPARLPAGPAQQRADGHGPDRQRPPRELRLDPAAADDQHLHARRPGRPRGHHPLGAARPLRQALRRRPGRHHQRQVRLLGDRGLPDRGRQARRRRSSARR